MKSEIKCFVCDETISNKNAPYNTVVNLPVCEKCKGSRQEEKKEKELLESLADGFVCGCI